ncbi:MAG: hypothetical protein JEZ14_11810 [Marinilabiliaceae bacterium]|nr:hypothetical protein [Marinilabiliaceae bacterium]
MVLSIPNFLRRRLRAIYTELRLIFRMLANFSGEVVYQLDAYEVEAGTNDLLWEGASSVNGVYFIMATIGNTEQVIKIVKID